MTNQANLQFVLDANVFITAHRNYYPFDLCPGFWECLIRHFLDGKLLSIDKVRDELLDTTKSEDEEPDALYSWAKDSPEGLFASSSDQAVVNAFGDVIAWLDTILSSLEGPKTLLPEKPMVGSSPTPKHLT